MSRYFVTGCAGFIGSHVVDRLLTDGHNIIGFDNFSTGKREFLAEALKNPAFTLVEGDLLDLAGLTKAMGRDAIEAVFHLAANADVRHGTEHPRKDLDQNTVVTFNVLESMRAAGIKRIVFSSTGSIYGEPAIFPTPEEAPFPVQTSLYGASKLAGEGLIEAYCEGFGFQAWIYRFVSVLGERYTHGHVIDFYRKLKADPNQIDVFGDGSQTKSYIYIADCVEGMLFGMKQATAKVNVFNLGTDETIQVRDSLKLIIEHLRLNPDVRYAGGKRGWIGDSPFIHLDCARLRALGWMPRTSIPDGVLLTLKWLMANPWVFEKQGARSQKLKVCVYGLWHLGSVTAACLAGAGFSTIGLDDDPAVVKGLAEGRPPIFEPGLEDLVRSGFVSRKLSFTTDKSVVGESDIVWVTFDTPVDDEDRADVMFVVNRICTLFPQLRDGAVVLISSQLPVGTVADIERRFAAVAGGRRVAFACSPENLRLGKAIEVFRQPERVIVGSRDGAEKAVITELLAPFSSNIIWVGTEAAELTKHAINAFLATCVTFINEIATLGEQVGANARDVERGMRSEPRIGPNAYIRPGAAFAGGTLARDVTFLGEIARQHGLPLDLIGNIIKSNRAHREWPIRKLRERLGSVANRKVALFGLAYKPGTDTTRRSLSVELGRTLAAAGATVTAFDPAVKTVPDAPAGFTVAASMADALFGADALVLMTEWPDFKTLKPDEVVACMATPTVLDQNGFVRYLAADPRINYFTIGESR